MIRRLACVPFPSLGVCGPCSRATPRTVSPSAPRALAPPIPAPLVPMMKHRQPVSRVRVCEMTLGCGPCSRYPDASSTTQPQPLNLSPQPLPRCWSSRCGGGVWAALTLPRSCLGGRPSISLTAACRPINQPHSRLPSHRSASQPPHSRLALPNRLTLPRPSHSEAVGNLAPLHWAGWHAFVASEALHDARRLAAARGHPSGALSRAPAVEYHAERGGSP
mmetsp:Transcript_30767/g.61754  ORF Transcript_30767/g.61754 Transcript_30767/m.61754 type:complete len:220 (+) Transcript_30767:246-905(+)